MDLLPLFANSLPFVHSKFLHSLAASHYFGLVHAAPLTLDEQFALIAEDIEGFGGLFVDESGGINVYLKDPSQTDFAKSVLSTKYGHLLGEHVASKIGSMQTHKGRYDFLELKGWKDLSIGLMKLPGVVYYDIAESENRIRIGVEGQKEMERIQQVMEGVHQQCRSSEAGIPRFCHCW